MADFVRELETKELIDKLLAGGYGNVVNAFLAHDGKCYTKKGRLNKSGACRVLDYKPKQLEDQLYRMRELLEPEQKVS